MSEHSLGVDRGPTGTREFLEPLETGASLTVGQIGADPHQDVVEDRHMIRLSAFAEHAVRGSGGGRTEPGKHRHRPDIASHGEGQDDSDERPGQRWTHGLPRCTEFDPVGAAAPGGS